MRYIYTTGSADVLLRTSWQVKVEFKQTKRGQLRADFQDRYGALCSIQESSIPGEDCVWLGVDVNFEGDELRHGRMHLSQEQARELIPVLRHFARRGSLGVDTTKDPYHVGAWVIGVGEDNLGIEGRIIQANVGETLVVQDWRKAGPEGQVITAWDAIDLFWEPYEMPDKIPSRYERLTEDDDDLTPDE